MHGDIHSFQAFGFVGLVLLGWAFRYELVGLVVGIGAFILGRLVRLTFRSLLWAARAAWRRFIRPTTNQRQEGRA